MSRRVRMCIMDVTYNRVVKMALLTNAENLKADTHFERICL